MVIVGSPAAREVTRRNLRGKNPKRNTKHKRENRNEKLKKESQKNTNT